MSKTVDELRNEIRLAVDRFERVESTAFTKETLQAVCEALEYELDGPERPSKAKMRAGIRFTLGLREEDKPDPEDSALRKSELEAIADALDTE